MTAWEFVEPWWSGSPAPIGCRCGGREGWTQSDDPDWWVCSSCKQPSRMVLEKSPVLNLMRYGPHHNELVETNDLTTKGEFTWIAEYSWTPEKVVGSVSGREARVWVHKSAVTANVS